MPRQNHPLRALAAPKTTPANPAAAETRLPTVALATKPALLASEDPKDYEKLDSAFRDHVEPLDIIEEMLAGAAAICRACEFPISPAICIAWSKSLSAVTYEKRAVSRRRTAIRMFDLMSLGFYS